MRSFVFGFILIGFVLGSVYAAEDDLLLDSDTVNKMNAYTKQSPSPQEMEAIQNRFKSLAASLNGFPEPPVLDQVLMIPAVEKKEKNNNTGGKDNE